MSKPSAASLIAWSFLLALAGAALWWWWAQPASDGPRYRSVVLERGPLRSTVAASGAVNPVTQVSVGTQVSGQIKDLFVDFNTEVQAGQLIAVIDPETFEYKVRQAQADVDAAASAVITARATVAASRAAVSRAQVDLQEAQRDHQRKASLAAQSFISQSEAERALALANTTAEALKSAEAQQGVTEAQVRSAEALVAQRQAALAQARVDLGRTRITSPVSGIVIKRTVERGQTVAASLQAPELFVIARNLNDMQVDASVDEADVGRIRVGQAGSFTVDAFPGQTFEGRVRQVRKAASNVNSVVTYVVVIGFSNPDGRLMPGMTANVRVVTEARDDVLRVPNAALRVRVPWADAARVPWADAARVPSAAPAPPAAPADATAAQTAPPGTPGRVYMLDAAGQPLPVRLRVGISDGTFSEVLATEGGDKLAAGDTVVTAVTGAPPAKARLPF